MSLNNLQPKFRIFVTKSYFAKGLMHLLDGRKLAEEIKKRIAREIKKTGLRPGLASILIGDNLASKLYLSIKEREAEEVGINFYKHKFQDAEKKVLSLIKKLNHDSKIHGILVQLPLPKGFDTEKIIATIDPRKDVDGFHPENLKLLRAGRPRYLPPTHAGILALLQNFKSQISNFKFQKSKAVILANSKMFAEPLKLLLEQNKIRTQIIYDKLLVAGYQLLVTKKAEIVIVAKGKPDFLGAQMIKKDAIVIDVGTNKVGGKLVGDVNFKEVSKKALAITPVPGGVGPMTVAMLLWNTLQAAKKMH